MTLRWDRPAAARRCACYNYCCTGDRTILSWLIPWNPREANALFWVELRQAQRRAAAETAAFIRVVHYNDESSFNLDNDFEMNPASTKTQKHGPTWDPSGQLYGAQTGFVYLFHMGPMWVPDNNMGPRSCPHFSQILPSFLPSRARFGIGPPVSKGPTLIAQLR